jgi:hypothetical protein
MTSQLLIGRPDFLPVQGTNLQSAVELHHRKQFAYCLITKTYVGKAEDESKFAKDCAEYSMTKRQGSMASKNSTQSWISNCTIAQYKEAVEYACRGQP